MRITFVLDTFGGGGKERRCLQVVQGLNQFGITDIQFIIINNNVAYPEIYQTSARVIIMDRKAFRMSDRQTYKTLKSFICDFKPDIVQGWGFLSLFFLNLLRITNKFTYIASHVADGNKPQGVSKWINKLTAILADAIVGNSLIGLKAYGIPSKKAICIYNGYNPERLEKAMTVNLDALRHELGIDTPYIVTMVARVDENKDYACFLNIARQICSKRNDVTFLSVGKGCLLDKFQQETISDQRIKFVGFRSDVEAILRMTTVSVLCTNIEKHQEGISNTILESMAMGVPVVATYGGGTPEVVDNGRCGYCIKNNVVSDFVEKVMSLIVDKELRAKFSLACKEIVAEKFSLKESTAKYCNLYNTLLNRGNK